MILRVDIIHQRGEGVDTETSASGAEVGVVQGYRGARVTGAALLDVPWTCPAHHAARRHFKPTRCLTLLRQSCV